MQASMRLKPRLSPEVIRLHVVVPQVNTAALWDLRQRSNRRQIRSIPAATSNCAFVAIVGPPCPPGIMTDVTNYSCVESCRLTENSLKGGL